ncbi:hypothetical protein KJI95_11670 [Shewanella sp. JM162201]|uniref:Uncharacterized protein n=1 Tax=Shewanella jiangmenensis TaxID=2837387 RepID=A0ABS5V3Z3_9GAMM|nr:hypothetical protein [Shewanella jiangmenensis]MBT1445179.1 hypothetical protein [Shewanella jiangmenensis]
MLIATNYPQVPLATSNAATDSLRVESQQRPPIVPAPELTKGHEERAFNPQNERTADEPQVQAKLQQRVDERQQQQHQQQQQKQSEQQAQQTPPAKPLKLPPRLPAGLNRKDVRIRTEPQPPRNPVGGKMATPPAGESASLYRAIAAHVGNFYRQTSEPALDGGLTLTV